MSRLETKNIKQLVIDTVTQPLSIGGIATDNSDAVISISGAGVLSFGSAALGNGSTAVTQSVGNNTTNIATTAFVNAEISNDAIVKSLLTTTGDIIYASAASTPARLAAGTSGYFLKSNGAAAPSWSAVTVPVGVTAGSTTTSTWINYNGTTAGAGLWDGGTTAPSGTTRLNYGGYLYSTQLYDNGSRVLTGNQTITLSGDATGSGTTAITVAVVDDSHSHSNSTISSLDASKISSGTLSGDRGITSGSTSSSFIKYNGTTATAGQFDGGTTAPTGTTRLNYGGYLYATRLYGAVYNDYAEYFEKGEEVEAGDVIAKDPNSNKFIKSTGAYNKKVIGVYSDSYGHCLGGNGDENDEENFIPIGLAGRVSVKIIGRVEEGDLLVTSEIPGFAMASNGYTPGTVIGKALENHFDDGISKIKMFIMNI